MKIYPIDDYKYYRIVIIVSFVINIVSALFVSVSPLTLDETGSYMMISDGFADMLSRSAINVQQTPLYYALLSVWTAIFGIKEVTLRLLSYLFYLMAIFLFYNSFKKKLNAEFAYIFLVIILLDSFLLMECGLRARPYSVAFFFFSLSLYLVIRAELSNKFYSRYIFFSALTMALSTYAHMISAVSLVVPIFLIYGSKVLPKRTLFNFLCAYLILVSPLSTKVTLLLRKSSDFSMYQNTSHLIFSLYLENVTFLESFVVLCISLIIAIPNKPFWNMISFKLDQQIFSHFKFLLFWVVCPVLIFALLNLLIGSFIMSKRYLFWTYPASAALYSYVLLFVFDMQLPKKNVLIIFISISTLFHAHYLYNKKNVVTWREVARTVNSLSSNSSNSIILLAAPFMEGYALNLLEDLRYDQNFKSPLLYYKTVLSISVFPPSDKSVELDKYFRKVLSIATKDKQELIFIFSEISNYSDNYSNKYDLRKYNLEKSLTMGSYKIDYFKIRDHKSSP